MGIWDSFKSRYFAPKTEQKPTLYAKEPKRGLGVSGGRESNPEHTSIYSILGADGNLIKSDTPKEVLDTLLFLSKYNADISNAVENIVSLANTEQEIGFNDSLPEDIAQKALQHLKREQKNWYTGGIEALRSDLYCQVAIYGCISVEKVPMNNLSGMSRVVLVNPRNIEFTYDKETDTYMPHQRIQSILDTNKTLIPLNPKTYSYIPVRRYSEKPYAVPPFLSALESVAMEKDMLAGFKKVINKIGILGFLQALVDMPEQLPNEKPDAYAARCQNFLAVNVIPELENGVASGIVAGFKGTHEFKVSGNDTNVTGAKELFNLIEELKMSGLKQDPRLLGRNFSTTETYGTVIMKKFTKQLSSFQYAVDQFISSLYELELILNGYAIDYVYVKSELPMLTDELNDQNAFGKKIENYKLLYEQGVISQTDLAQALGWDKPDQEAPRTQPNTNTQQIQNSIPTETQILEAINQLYVIDGRYYKRSFDYGTNCECSTHLSLKSVGNDKLDQLIEDYFGAIQLGYRKATKKATLMIAEALEKLGEGATQQQVSDTIIFNLYKDWNTNFTAKQEKVIKQWVSEIHKVFRSDKAFVSPLPSFDPKNPPKAILGLRDLRVQEFYTKSDKLYLGKFIADEDTRARLQEFIKDEFVGNGLPIGKGMNTSTSTIFREQFNDLLIGEEWKISRIVSTTANRMRNTAGVMYMKDSSATKYKILELNDNKTCAWCSELNGKEFSIDTAISEIDNTMSGDPANLKYDKPFITSEYSPEQIGKLSQGELDKMGIVVPSHPFCRGQVIASL